jgi:hypothetical protein
MKSYLDKISTLGIICPHSRCKESLLSKDAFWDHAILVHGVPLFGPAGVTKKRKGTADQGDEDESSGQGTPKPLCASPNSNKTFMRSTRRLEADTSGLNEVFRPTLEEPTVAETP